MINKQCKIEKGLSKYKLALEFLSKRLTPEDWNAMIGKNTLEDLDYDPTRSATPSPGPDSY